MCPSKATFSVVDIVSEGIQVFKKAGDPSRHFVVQPLSIFTSTFHILLQLHTYTLYWQSCNTHPGLFAYFNIHLHMFTKRDRAIDVKSYNKWFSVSVNNELVSTWEQLIAPPMERMSPWMVTFSTSGKSPRCLPRCPLIFNNCSSKNCCCVAI